MAKNNDVLVKVNGVTKRVKCRKDGRYRVSYPVNTEQTEIGGKKKYLYYDIYAYGEAELQSKINQYEQSIVQAREDFIPNIEKWLRQTKLGIVKDTTYDRADQILRNQIIPAAQKLQHKKIVDITVQDCVSMLEYIRAKMLEDKKIRIKDEEKLAKSIEQYDGSNTRRKVIDLLAEYFDYALELGIVDKNPARSKTIQKMKGKASILKNESFLSDEELERIKAAIDCPHKYETVSRSGNTYENNKTVPQGNFFLFMVNTGLRAGEAVGLKYSDIDFKNKTMQVRNNITSTDKRDDEGNRIGGRTTQEGTPKTEGSYETVPLSDESIRLLKKLLEEERERNEDKDYDSYIVHEIRKRKTPDGSQGFISTHALYKRWQTLCLYAGVKPRGVHCLRHTFAMRALEQTDGDIFLVSKLLRHTRVSTTADLYLNKHQPYREEDLRKIKI